MIVFLILQFFLILKYVLLYVLFCFGINLIFRGIYIMIFPTSKYFKIYLHKSEKFKTKVNPIYKIYVKNYSEGEYYYIKKFSLKYKESEGYDIISFITIPFPTLIFKYGYYEEEYNYKLCSIKDIETCNTNIGELYEKENAKAMELYDIELAKVNKAKQKLDDLNKVYNDNIV